LAKLKVATAEMPVMVVFLRKFLRDIDIILSPTP
jgi:hypothetical protein